MSPPLLGNGERIKLGCLERLSLVGVPALCAAPIDGIVQLAVGPKLLDGYAAYDGLPERLTAPRGIEGRQFEGVGTVDRRHPYRA